MKIRVQHENGTIGTLSLGDAVLIREGRHLNRIVTTTDCEYIFTPDGHYDGWGANVQTTEIEASAVLHAMEEKSETADS